MSFGSNTISFGGKRHAIKGFEFIICPESDQRNYSCMYDLNVSEMAFEIQFDPASRPELMRFVKSIEQTIVQASS